MKRFGLEGCETLIPGLKVLCDTLVNLDCLRIFIGMPHRGRLSVLAHVVRKPLEQIFAEFQGKSPLKKEDMHLASTGDVKYHLGTQYSRKYPDGKVL